MSDDYRQGLELRVSTLEKMLERLASREKVATVVPWNPISGGVVYIDPSGTGALTTEAAFIYDDTNDELVFGRGRLTEQATPSTPVNPYAILFANSVGTLSGIDDAGVVRQMVRFAEGTFTPTYFGSATAGVTTYTLQDGRYRRFENIVFITIRMAWTNATGTGNGQVGNLPFTSEATSDQPLLILSANIGYTNAGLRAFTGNGINFLQLFDQVVGAFTASAIDIAGELIIEGFYLI